MSRRFAIAAAGSVLVHALVLVCLARLESPRAPVSIGRKVDGAIAVELLGAAAATGAGMPAEEGSGKGTSPASAGVSRERSGSSRAKGGTPGPPVKGSEPSGGDGASESGREAAAAPRVPASGDVDSAMQAADDVTGSQATGPASSLIGAEPGGETGRVRPTAITAGVASSDGSPAPGSPIGAGSDEPRRRGGGAGSGTGTGASDGGGRGAAPNGIDGAAWSMLEAHLRAHAARCYPPAARRRSIQGGAEIRFCIGTHGEPTGIRLEKSSGSSLLDRAAIDCVLRDAAPLPGPRGCASVPVWFRL